MAANLIDVVPVHLESAGNVVIVQGETDIAKQIGDLVASSHASSP